jgi:hypothetical protein
VVVVLVGALVASSVVYAFSRAGLSDTGATTPAPRHHPVVAGPFAGTWHVHTTSLTVAADGRGRATWPIGVDCGTGIGKAPPPCDARVPSTIVLPDGVRSPVEDVVDGGHATVRLTSVTGRTAHALVTASSDPTALPDGPAVLRVSSDDLLQLDPHVAPLEAHLRWQALCGPRAASLPLSEQLSRGINCGA